MKREPLRPPGAPHLGETYRDWRDFTERVAQPWVDGEDLDDRAENWYRALMIEADPYYLAVALVMANNTIQRLERAVDRLGRRAVDRLAGKQQPPPGYPLGADEWNRHATIENDPER